LYDTISIKRINARTVESTLKKSGKLMSKARRVVFKDGKTMTLTISGTKQTARKCATSPSTKNNNAAGHREECHPRCLNRASLGTGSYATVDFGGYAHVRAVSNQELNSQGV
jgi:hypothetical protein